MGYKEKEADPLSLVATVIEAANMGKGVFGKDGPVFRTKTPAKDTGGAVQPKDKLMQRALASEHRVKPKAKQETPEWAKEVVEGLKHGDLPPEAKITRAAVESQEIIVKTKEAGQAQWLVGEKGVPESELIAQVVADISSSKLNNDPDYLLVKGAQLRWAMRTDTPPEVQAEARHFLRRIHQKVLEQQQAAGRLPLEKVSVLGQDVWSPKIEDGKVQLSPAEMDLFNTIGHNLTGVESGMAATGRTKGRGPDYQWNDKKEKLPKGKAYESLRRKLETFNARAARLNGAALDREIIEAFHDITSEPVDQLDRIPTFLKRLGDRFSELSESQRREGRGWSSLWVSEPIQQRYFLNSFLEVRRTQDRLSRETMLLDNRFKQSVEHQFQQHISFLESEDFRTNGMRFYKDRANWERITRETGVRIDGTRGHGPEDHPMYKEFADNKQYERLRSELVKQLNATDMLQRNFVSWELGKQEEMGVGLEGFAEPGLLAVLNDRGFNTDTLDTLERLGEHVMYGHDGKLINVSGPVLQRLKNDAVHQLWGFQKDRLQAKFQEKYGAGAVLTEQDIKASVDEMYMWSVVTGRRAEWSMRGLAPQQSGGRGTNPHQYAGELGGDAKIKQALRPFSQLELRWATASDVAKATIEEYANFHARRLGVDKELGQMIQQQVVGSEEYNNLVRLAFSITDESTEDKISDALGVFKFDRKGNHITPPRTIDKVNKDYLLRQLIFRKGLEIGEPSAVAGYGYFGSGWNRTEIIRSYDEIFGKNLAIGLHERTAKDVAGLFDADVVEHKIEEAKPDPKNMEEIRKGLIRVAPDRPQDEGMLVAMARYSPTHIWESLHTNLEHQSVEFFNAHAQEFDIFKHGEEATQAITKDRPDLLMKRFLLRHRLINKALADWEDPQYARLPKDHPDRLRHKGLSPIDYSRDVTDPRQIAVINEWCRRTETDPGEYLKVAREFADFALKPEVLHEASNPVNASFFLSVHAVDPRFHRVDDFSKLWQNQETGEWVDKRKEEIGPWSQRIANSNGYGAGAGLHRWVGDQVNVWKVLAPHLHPLLDAKNAREFEEHLEPFVETIKFTGGGNAKALTAEMLYYTHIKINQLDNWKDWLGMGGDNSLTMDSVAERIGGKGFQVINMREAEELEHHAEAVAGLKFHNFTPHFAHESKKELKQIISIFGKEVPAIWVYRLWALSGLVGLGAAIAVISKAWDSFKSGVSGESSHSSN
ncbi:hypothetical protein HY948_04955 [Candidatus Gottesmanbacteria bacterium]|nr:hypothetical protein [Candidatus Gottesmanbacteria bacterium]